MKGSWLGRTQSTTGIHAPVMGCALERIPQVRLFSPGNVWFVLVSLAFLLVAWILPTSGFALSVSAGSVSAPSSEQGAVNLTLRRTLNRPGAANEGSDLRVTVSNLTDKSFTVTWLSRAIESGQVRLKDGSVYDDARAAGYSGQTHYVTVRGLQPNTVYAFDVLSGGKAYDNGGAHWSVMTGATLEPRPPDVITGWVKNADGSNAADVVILATLDRAEEGYPSAMLSTLVTASNGGLFTLDLAETRMLSASSVYLGYPVASDYLGYPVGSDHYMSNIVSLMAVSATDTAYLTMDVADPRLRSRDPSRLIVLTLSSNSLAPTAGTP